MSNIYANNINPRSGNTVTFPQNIRVLGTATYEDVANVDSVGIITAQNGIHVTGGVQVATGATISGSTNTITALTNGSEALRIDSSGNLLLGGVNNSTAKVKLIQDTDGGGIYVRAPGNQPTWKAFRVIDNTNFDTDTIQLYSNGEAYFAGNVGIGTDDPGHKLEVQSGGNGTFFINGRSSTGVNIFRVYESSNGDGNNGMLYLNDGSGNLDVKLSTNGYSWFKGGNVGIGTENPSQNLVVYGPNSTTFSPIVLTMGVRGSNAALSGNAGAGIQFGGNYIDGASTQTTLAGISGIKENTVDGNYDGALLFHTRTNGGLGGERMRITSSGDSQVLVGTVNGSNNSGAGLKMKGGSAATYDTVINAATNINTHHLYNINATNNGYRFYLMANGGISNFAGNNTNLCDEREKKNIAPLEDKWDTVKSWELKKFHYNDDADTDDLKCGVIAQQVETICPEVITDFMKDEGVNRKGVKEQQMTWMAIKALQEAMDRIETLEQRLADAGL